MSANAVTTFSSAELQERLRERVKGIFGELVPDDVWNAMIDNEIRAFREKGLPDLVRDEMKKLIIARLQEEFAKPAWHGNEFWTMVMMQQITEPGEAVKEILGKLLGENATDFMRLQTEQLMGGAMQVAINHMRNNLQQMVQRGY